MQPRIGRRKRHSLFKLHLSLWKLVALEVHVPEMFTNTRVFGVLLFQKYLALQIQVVRFIRLPTRQASAALFAALLA